MEPAWSVAEVGRALARYGRPAEPARLAVRALPGGKATLNLRVDTGDVALVLRRYAAADASEAVRWELELVRFLTARGFPTAPLLATPAGELTVPFAGRVGRHRAALPGGVVHHDAHAGNVLVDAAGRVVALLDFDDAYPGLLLADLANLLWYWAAPWADPRLDLGRAARLVACYHRARPLGAAEREVLPDLVARRLLARAVADVRRALRDAPADPAADGLPALARYRELTAHPHWRRELRTALLADAVGAGGGASVGGRGAPGRC